MGPFGVSLEDIHVIRGGVKGCCALHVCILTSVGRLFILERSNFKKKLKKLF